MKYSLIFIALVLNSCTQIEERDSYKDFADFQKNTLSEVVPAKTYSLNMCLQLAIENNLALYAMKLEQAVSDDKAMAHLLTALPSLRASYNESTRSNEPGATSEGIEDGFESLRASKSSERHLGYFRLEMALSSLDFGLAYINRHFENDQKKKAFINRSKAERELKFQVIQAYYSVAAAQYVLAKTQQELIKNEDTLKKVESLFDKQYISRFELFRFKRKFLQARKQLREYERNHVNYCLNLTALLGLYPSENINVDTTGFICDLQTGRFKLDYQAPVYEDLEKNALLRREEIITMDIESHISLLKEKSELLKLFPNVKLFAAFNSNDNSFLYNKSWTELGFNVIIDFMKIPSRLKNMSAEEKQRTVIKFKQYSIMLNVIAQLKIAYANIEEVKERLSLKEDIYRIIQQENKLTREAFKKGTRNQLDVLEKDIDLLISHIQRTATFANYNVALHRLLNISASPQRDLRDMVK